MSENQNRPRVLAAMSHPDDAEILVGGTLLLLREQGCDVGILSMTSGDCGSATLSREEISRLRLAEARDAAAFLDGWYGCAGLRDIEVIFNAENLRRVVERMREFRPDVVITHSPIDYMLDHEETTRLVRGATFALAMPLYETREIAPAPPASGTPALYYADPVEGLDYFGHRIQPDFHVEITPVLDAKRELLSRHRTQRDWLRAHHGVDEYLNRMTEWAAIYGQECGVEYAEGLRQHRGHGYPHDPVLQDLLGSAIRHQN
jgi:N-acetylglucosamine malate deacetylase 1